MSFVPKERGLSLAGVAFGSGRTRLFRTEIILHGL
jgi:hypothetical protein